VKKQVPSSTSEKQKNAENISFPIVGIGASAGGLETLEMFFGNVPKNSGLAFVVIQHLDPNHVGIMPELLQRTTVMKVIQAADKMQVKPNHVYVIPPNKSMSVLNGSLYLFEPVESRGLRLPIDYFFRSLADDQHENSIGVILSGMGSDGSLGLKAIKEQNGIVAVQDPATAKFEGMPQSAVNAVVVDILAPANQLPEKLIAFLNHSPAIVQKTEIDDLSKSNLEKIVILLRTQTGHDFSLYKKNTLYRRIERRMNVHQIDKIAYYVRFLQENSSELDILFKELLIGVTNFFRDAVVWEKLKEKVLPDLFNTVPNGYVFRAWVTGCSTGEEAYSLAIVFKEAYEKVKRDKNFTLQIFATDIDSDAIERGRKGFFSANIAADVSPERLSQFFIKEDTYFRVNTSIREMVVFAPQNVIKDPPFTKVDLLLCRNLLIYLESELQRKLMNLFHYALKTGGVMLLGSAETENSQNKLFSVIDSKLKIYKRTANAANTELMDFPDTFKHPTEKARESIKTVKVIDNIQTLANQLLLERFAPASVLTNTEGDILYITGRTGKYLEPAAGKANMNIYAMARDGLKNELPGAIRKAKLSTEPVKLNKLKIGTNGGTQIVDVTLQRIEKPEAIKGTIMIVFADVTDIPRPARRKSKAGNQQSTIREQELENELKQANEELQSTREEMQTTQEELKSTNEEMQSTNEELQSTNEELTTSKEEMQSLNEELQTVNVELQSKIADYMAANNDMKNLLNSTDIATLFLDKELNIRRFTEQTTKLFKLRQTDIGRPFTEIVTKLHYPEITNHAREVLRTLVFKETEIATIEQRWFTIRIMPYRTVDDHIDGLVITFIDNTPQKTAINELHKIKRNFEHTLQNSNIILALCDNDLRYTWIFNQAPGLDETRLLGKQDSEINSNEDASALMKLKKHVLDTGKPTQATILYPLVKGKTPYHVTAQPLTDKQGKITGISTCAIECVTEMPITKHK
jgi:two-component system CheB/CheR fusion protein